MPESPYPMAEESKKTKAEQCVYIFIMWQQYEDFWIRCISRTGFHSDKLYSLKYEWQF
jgi:hypothetical protein